MPVQAHGVRWCCEVHECGFVLRKEQLKWGEAPDGRHEASGLNKTSQNVAWAGYRAKC